jgi:hypothetical protein
VTIKLRLVPRAALIARVSPHLAATVAGGDGIESVYSGGVYTVGLGTDTLVEALTISASDRDNLLVAIYNEDTDTYRKVGIDTLLGVGSIAQAWDADLDALAANSTDGFWTHTGAGTGSARTITGTAAEITVTNGDGVSGNPTVSLPLSLTFTGKTVTGGTFSAPTIAGGTHTAITGLGIRSTGAAYDLTLASSEVLTAGRTLSVVMGDAARSLTFTANATIGGTHSGTSSGTNTGDQTITLTGDVTGTGTGSFVATIGATKVTSAMLNADVFSTAHSWAGQQTFVAPILGTIASGVATNLTGTAAGLTAGNVTTNANLTGDVTSVGNATTLTNAPVIAKVLTGYTSGAGTISATDSILSAIQKLNGNDATNANLTGVITSVGNATSIASQTGTGTKFVVDTSPTLVTPVLGVAAGTSLALGGATIGSNALAVTGTALFNSAVTLGAAITYGGVALSNSVTGTGSMVLSADAALTGNPTVPTQTAGNNTTRIASTAFVTAAVAASTTGVASFNTLTGTVTSSVVVQKFTSSGTYTPTSGMLHCIIECIGGGAGGGGVGGAAGSNYTGGGGGAGSTSIKFSTAAAIGASQTVTIGAGGGGGASGSNNGTAGGDTSLGAICIGKGGSGGKYGSTVQLPDGGLGGVAGTGDVTGTGATGMPGVYGTGLTANFHSGTGGSSPWGSGGLAKASNSGSTQAGQAASGYGSGGSGGAVNNTASNAAGGDGTPGIVIITEFVNL